MTDSVAWLAGLLEGEGSFIEWQDTRNDKWRCKIFLKMTDQDIVERAQAVTGGLGTICVNNPPSKPAHWKSGWIWQVQSIPDAIYVMLAVLPYMGQRRSEKITEILTHAVEYGWMEVSK